jgi:hypothetical protein
LLLAAVPLAAQPVEQVQADYRVDMEVVERSVVRIVVVERGFDGDYVVATGSGFVVAPGVVVSNYHVVARSVEGGDRFYLLVVPPEGQGQQAVDATLLSQWSDADLAALSAPTLRLPALPVSIARPKKDARVRVAGYPGVADDLLGVGGSGYLEPTEPDSNQGQISRAMTIPVYQDFDWFLYSHDASISTGDSGGPLVDACGRVIGVTNAYLRAQLSDDGQILLPGNQFLAIQSRMLPDLLSAGEVAWIPAAAACIDEPEPVESAPTQTFVPEPPADPEPSTNEFLGGIALLIAALAGVAAIVWLIGRALMRAAPETRRALLIAAGLIGGAGLLRLSGFGFGGEAGSTPESQRAVLACDNESLGSTQFDFDGGSPCVNGRTPYLRTAEGYERLLLSGNRLARLRISADRTAFTREFWDLDAAELRDTRTTRDTLGELACLGGERARAQVDERLRQFATAVATVTTRPHSEIASFQCEPAAIE